MMNETFSDLNVLPELTEKLCRHRITVPTTIQKLVIPRLNDGDTVLFHSATGTGKTFAYLLPFLGKITGLTSQKTGQKTGTVFLILAPTLELCSQIKREADFLLADSRIQSGLIIGSASMSRQIESLKKDKPALIVGNPSRLLQLASMGKLKLNTVQFLVLDEGDRLVADEQYEQTAALCALIRAGRQAASCSATFSAKSRERLMQLLGGGTVTVETDEQEILREHIRHIAFFAENRRKIKTLSSVLNAARIKKALVFTAETGQIGTIVASLQYHGRAAAGLSGKVDKKLRKHSLDEFRSGTVNVLVASDLAARGLDIPDISHVIALDVPETAEAYLHRAGRTARAGAYGTMMTIGNAPEMQHLATLEKQLGIVVHPRLLYRGSIVAPEQPEQP